MTLITDNHLPFRDALMPASFRGAMFHVEAGGKESGRRIVLHEFPKKEFPYAEDMGRRAFAFSVRGYCITYVRDTQFPLYSKDYRRARNLLISELEHDGPGILQLPTLSPVDVVCQQYRITEEEKLGGYCVFDMQFVEYGIPPQAIGIVSGRDNLIVKSQVMIKQMVDETMTRENRTRR